MANKVKWRRVGSERRGHEKEDRRVRVENQRTKTRTSLAWKSEACWFKARPKKYHRKDDDEVDFVWFVDADSTPTLPFIVEKSAAHPRRDRVAIAIGGNTVCQNNRIPKLARSIQVLILLPAWKTRTRSILDDEWVVDHDDRPPVRQLGIMSDRGRERARGKGRRLVLRKFSLLLTKLSTFLPSTSSI